MQWSLFVLLLMGQCGSTTFHFHFINQTKTWKEAQSYCRQHYTDLATVVDKTDMDRLSDGTKGRDGAWIGLHNQPGKDNRKWHWTQPGVEFTGDYSFNEGQDKNCAMMKWENKMTAEKCTKEKDFICFKEKRPGEVKDEYYYIEDEMTWLKAQSYCRKDYTDLVSGPDQLEDNKFKEKLQDENQDVWIGLFRDNWRWSNGSVSSFRDRCLDFFEDKTVEECVMIENGNWSFDRCDKAKPFVCYDDKVVLIEIEKTWEDALNYCREHQHDLVSITNHHQQMWVQQRVQQRVNHNTSPVWLGLRYSCFLDLWFWVNDNLVCYDRWAKGETREGCDRAAAMNPGEPHDWVIKPDSEKFHFVCSLKES